MNPATIEAAARQDVGLIAREYMKAVSYRLGEKPMFIEKFPENFLYAGFIAKAWPDARLVYLRRNPMDTCFAMYKQSYFRYAYTLENVGRYYIAHDRLLPALAVSCWAIDWSKSSTRRSSPTRKETDPKAARQAGLEFESACLQFETKPGRQRYGELGPGAREDPRPLSYSVAATSRRMAPLRRYV